MPVLCLPEQQIDDPAPADMFTRQATTPPWIIAAGFSDTGISGKWRDNSIKLVDYQLYKTSFAAGTHVALGSSPIDFIIIIK